MINLAIIPARSGSKRLLKKNVYPLGGKALIRWATKAVVDSGRFDIIAILTDDIEIFEEAKKEDDVGTAIEWVDRSPEYATDSSTVLDAVLNDVIDANLYENVDIPEQTKKYKHSTFLHVVLFLVKRLIIAVVTVFLDFLPPVQIAVSIYLTLVSSYFTVTTQPMELWYLNWIELANDFLFISVNYFMFLFTDFVTLPTMRNSIGDFCFNYLLSYLSGICLFIVFMIILTLRMFRQDRIRKLRMLTLSLKKD